MNHNSYTGCLTLLYQLLLRNVAVLAMGCQSSNHPTVYIYISCFFSHGASIGSIGQGVAELLKLLSRKPKWVITRSAKSSRYVGRVSQASSSSSTDPFLVCTSLFLKHFLTIHPLTILNWPSSFHHIWSISIRRLFGSYVLAIVDDPQHQKTQSADSSMFGFPQARLGWCWAAQSRCGATLDLMATGSGHSLLFFIYWTWQWTGWWISGKMLTFHSKLIVYHTVPFGCAGKSGQVVWWVSGNVSIFDGSFPWPRLIIEW